MFIASNLDGSSETELELKGTSEVTTFSRFGTETQKSCAACSRSHISACQNPEPDTRVLVGPWWGVTYRTLASTTPSSGLGSTEASVLVRGPGRGLPQRANCQSSPGQAGKQDVLQDKLAPHLQSSPFQGCLLFLPSQHLSAGHPSPPLPRRPKEGQAAAFVTPLRRAEQGLQMV